MACMYDCADASTVETTMLSYDAAPPAEQFALLRIWYTVDAVRAFPHDVEAVARLLHGTLTVQIDVPDVSVTS